MCTPLTKNTLVKQTHGYNDTSDFHSLVGATALES